MCSLELVNDLSTSLLFSLVQGLASGLCLAKAASQSSDGWIDTDGLWQDQATMFQPIHPQR